MILYCLKKSFIIIFLLLACIANLYAQTDSANKKLNTGKQIFNNLQWGAIHSVPISLSLPQIGPVQISPGISYSERWYQQQLVLGFDKIHNKRDTTSAKKGFYTARDMSFSLGLSTRIFGSFTFGKHAAVQAIRHEIRPSISISYKPDFNRSSYYDLQSDTINKLFSRTSIYSNIIYGFISL